MNESFSEKYQDNRVFVGGISWKADEQSLANFFSTYGPIVDCKIIMDKSTGKSKGYGFVTFEDKETAERVKREGNIYFQGKMMNVGEAVRKTDSRQQRKQQQMERNDQYNPQMQPDFETDQIRENKQPFVSQSGVNSSFLQPQTLNQPLYAPQTYMQTAPDGTLIQGMGIPMYYSTQPYYGVNIPAFLTTGYPSSTQSYQTTTAQNQSPVQKPQQQVQQQQQQQQQQPQYAQNPVPGWRPIGAPQQHRSPAHQQ